MWGLDLTTILLILLGICAVLFAIVVVAVVAVTINEWRALRRRSHMRALRQPSKPLPPIAETAAATPVDADSQIPAGSGEFAPLPSELNWLSKPLNVPVQPQADAAVELTAPQVPSAVGLLPTEPRPVSATIVMQAELATNPVVAEAALQAPSDPAQPPAPDFIRPQTEFAPPPLQPVPVLPGQRPALTLREILRIPQPPMEAVATPTPLNLSGPFPRSVTVAYPTDAIGPEAPSSNPAGAADNAKPGPDSDMDTKSG